MVRMELRRLMNNRITEEAYPTFFPTILSGLLTGFGVAAGLWLMNSLLRRKRS